MNTMIVCVLVSFLAFACGSAAVQPHPVSYDRGILIPATEDGGISVIVSEAALKKRATAKQPLRGTQPGVFLLTVVSPPVEVDCSVDILDFDTLEVITTRKTIEEAVAYLEAHPRVEVVDETTYETGPAGILRLDEACPVTYEALASN